MNTEEKNLFQNRSHNLAQILKNEFRDDLDEFCERLQLKKETVTKFLNPNSDRPCKDRAARRIESLLKKSPHTLDYQYDDKKETYYVTIGTNAHYTYEVIKTLQEEQSVKECSAVLGDFDILLKVEVENFLFLDLLLAKVAKLPGVKRSQTYLSIKELRWQRNQAENMNLPPKNAQYYSSNGIEEYIERKINYHLDKIKELEKGEIAIQDKDSVPLESEKILDGTALSIRAIRTPDEEMRGFDDYIATEEKLIRDGVKSQRIILLPEDSYAQEWKKYKEDYDRFNAIGSEVRFLFINEWTATPLSESVEQFVIIDHKFICVRREAMNRLLIKRSKEMVELYSAAFATNWYHSLSLAQVQEKFKSHQTPRIAVPHVD